MSFIEGVNECLGQENGRRKLTPSFTHKMERLQTTEETQLIPFHSSNNIISFLILRGKVFSSSSPTLWLPSSIYTSTKLQIRNFNL